MMQITPSYYRIMAGAKSVFAQEFLKGGFIAANWNIDQDLTHDLPDDWREFNHRFIPVYLEALPDKTKISAGLACGMLHTICKGSKTGVTLSLHLVGMNITSWVKLFQTTTTCASGEVKAIVEKSNGLNKLSLEN